MAEVWSHTEDIQNERISCSGAGAWDWGVRRKKEVLEARLKGSMNVGMQMVTAADPTNPMLWRSRCQYEGKVPTDGALAFLIPFQWPNGAHRCYVLVYEFRDLRKPNALSLDSTPGERSPVNTPDHFSADFGTNHVSALMHHDGANAQYVFLYQGDFTLSATRPDWLGQTWRDSGRIILKSGRHFNYGLRSNNSSLTVTVSGWLTAWALPLAHGRVFVLHDDGTLDQYRLFPSVAQARDLAGLTEIVREGRGPVITRRATDGIPMPSESTHR
jgi:hypothetical protein